MVIGGEQIYRLCLPHANRLYLTRVDALVDGDAFFPDFDQKAWQQVSEKMPQQVQSHPYRFLVLERIKTGIGKKAFILVTRRSFMYNFAPLMR